MALRINGMGGRHVVPNVLSRKYRFTAFPGSKMECDVKSKDGKIEKKSINAEKKIREAWNFVSKVAAAHKPCNDYFKTLRRKKTLKEVLAEGDIILHCLVPKEGYTFNDLPDAVHAGRDIGLDPNIILFDKTRVLSAILIHEIAHIAGASTNPDSKDPRALDAEKALLYCKCEKYYRKDAYGMKSIQNMKIQEPGETRMA